MSFRFVRRLSATLIASAIATAAFASGTSLIWRGDVTTARGVVDDVAKAWEHTGHGRIELQPFNTASGIDAVSQGTADLAGSARGSSGSSEDSSLTFTPVAWGALVMVTNVANPVSNLTLKQLHDIYYGKITNWSEVGGPDKPIDLYAVASPGDGVEYSLRRLIFGRGNQPVAAPRLYLNTNQLQQGIALDPMGLGVSTLSDARGNRKLKALSIGGVAPSIASLANGSYPLYTPLYLVTNPSSPKATDTQAFIAFVDSATGKSIMREHGLVPYSEGTTLIADDASRRSRILAEIGEHPYTGPAERAPTLAPASGAARVIANSKMLAAIQHGNPAKARREAIATLRTGPIVASVTAVNGSAAYTSVAAERPSLAHVSGAAISVAVLDLHGSRFARVSGDAAYGPAKPERSKAAQRAEHLARVAAPAKAMPQRRVAEAHVRHAHAQRPLLHRVAAGETLYSIAHKHDVDVAQVRAWNHLKGNTVRIGQTLVVGRR